MTEPNRLQTLTQFLEQNPNDAFARYGLAMEYSKLARGLISPLLLLDPGGGVVFNELRAEA